MIYEYLTAFTVTGVQFDAAEVPLLERTTPEINARFSKNIDELCRYADEEMAFRNELLDAYFRGERIGLPNRIVNLQAARNKPSIYFLAIRCRGALSMDDSQLRQSVPPGFRFGADLINKDEIREKRNPDVQRVVDAAVCAFENLDAAMTSVVDSVYAIDQNASPVYSITPRAGFGHVFVNKNVGASEIASFEHFFESNAFSEFSRSATLFAASCDSMADDLRAFRCAWAAIETLTKQYHRKVFPTKSFKIPLERKFSDIAPTLFPKTTTDEVKLFANLYRIRNGFYHGSTDDDLRQPTRAAKAFLRRFWRAVS